MTEQQSFDAAMRAILPEVFAVNVFESPTINLCQCGEDVGHSNDLCPECAQNAADATREYWDNMADADRNRFDGGTK